PATTEISTLSLHDALPISVERVETLLEAPEGAIHLGQVDGRVLDGGTDDGPLVLPLTLAVESHPELVEQHLGEVVRGDGDVFAADRKSTRLNSSHSQISYA